MGRVVVSDVSEAIKVNQQICGDVIDGRIVTVCADSG